MHCPLAIDDEAVDVNDNDRLDSQDSNQDPGYESSFINDAPVEQSYLGPTFEAEVPAKEHACASTAKRKQIFQLIISSVLSLGAIFEGATHSPH